MTNFGENPAFGSRRYRTKLKMYSGFPDVIALLDILFLALLFIVLASAFVKVSGVSVSLPRVSSHSMARLERVVVSLTKPDKSGEVKVFFRDKPVDMETLLGEFGKVHKSSPKAVIIIRADREVPFENVAKVMSTARMAGAPSFIAVQPDKGKGPENFGEKNFGEKN